MPHSCAACGAVLVPADVRLQGVNGTVVEVCWICWGINRDLEPGYIAKAIELHRPE